MTRSLNKLLERIVDTFWYNLGRVPEKEYYIEHHVERGNLAVVEHLLQANPALAQCRDMFANTLLIMAVWERQVEMCKLLLRQGCDINAADDHGATALHHAIDMQSLAIAKLLIAHGASLTIQDENGETPLDLADPSDRKMFEEIINHSIRPNSGSGS